MELLDGKVVSKAIKADLKIKVEERKAQGLKIPHLVAVLIGEDPASASYVRSKVRSCEQVGFESTLIKRESDITQTELLQIVEDLNNDDNVDGFIVQLPLPKHIDEHEVTLAIDPKKDVDGFHPVNFGRMAQGLPSYIPATPLGIVKMLEHYEIETSGKHCVDCTVTLTHSRTRDIGDELRRADIIVAAIGIPNFIDAERVKEGAIVIDVGINRVEDSSRERGYRLVGDVDFDSVASKASYITPVPGGVGLMTVASLMLQTYYSCAGTIYERD